MPSFFPQDLDAYVRAHSTPADTVSRAIARETQERTTHPQMMVGPVEGRFLTLLARLSHARRIVEIGTFTGSSALALAEGLPDDGIVLTCDVDADTAAIASRHWADSPHGHKIDLRMGPAIETLSRLDGPFDLVFIDADKSSYIDYWEAVVPKTRPGGVILADNVLWSGRVLDPRSPDDHAIVRFNRHVAADPRVEQVVLPLRDGVTLAVVG